MFGVVRGLPGLLDQVYGVNEVHVVLVGLLEQPGGRHVTINVLSMTPSGSKESRKQLYGAKIGQTPKYFCIGGSDTEVLS